MVSKYFREAGVYDKEIIGNGIQHSHREGNAVTEKPPVQRASRSDGQGTKEGLKDRYVAALLEGKHEQATSVVDVALGQGLNPKSVYFDIVVAGQNRFGEMWAEGRLSIAQEHVATQITFAELGRLRPMLKRRRGIGKTVVVAGVEGDPHALGGRTVADFLYMEGWDVDFLGSDLPTSALVDHVRRRSPDVVGLSVTIGGASESAKQAVAAIRSLDKVPKIMVGGPALKSSESNASDIGADAYCVSSEQANDVARELVGLPRPASSLPEYLKTLGERIQSIRRAQQRSQQDVAETSGLERAYISAIEHGKHNITLGAVMKLASALGIPFEELLVGRNEGNE